MTESHTTPAATALPQASDNLRPVPWFGCSAHFFKSLRNLHAKKSAFCSA
jgi:hypothetical protein